MIVNEVMLALASYAGNWNEKKGVWEFSATIAERKAFLSKKKLTYSARMRVDDAAKVVNFSELLVESGSGVSAGGGMDDMTPGFGFKTESYNTFKGLRQGSIEEQFILFGKEYSYTFDFRTIRAAIQGIVEKAGYHFDYQILPVK